jgi:hypothetical protein
VIAVAALGGSAGGCDQGKQHDQATSGPLVSVSGANIGPNRSLPADAAIKIQFDRMLMPSTITRQSIGVYDANNGTLLPIVTYDPVARIVTLSPQANGPWLKPDQPYKVILYVPKDGNDPNGFRAIDRAPLRADDPHVEIGFLTTNPSGAGSAEPSVDYCRDVAPVFQQRCSASSCHGARITSGDTTRFGDGLSSPAAGLILETSEGMRHAINRVANGANTGARSQAQEPAKIFGIDMALVSPGFPERSWLMYKLLLATPSDPATTPPATFARCDGRALVSRAAVCSTSADCNAGLPGTGTVCDKGTNTCLDGCDQDSDCAVGTCDTTAKQCKTLPPSLGGVCAQDTDCGSAAGWQRACDPQAKKCAAVLAPAPLAGIVPKDLATPPDDIERAVLSDYVLGLQMPYPNMSANGPTNGNPALTFDELERVRLWIAGGAVITSECVCKQ